MCHVRVVCANVCAVVRVVVRVIEVVDRLVQGTSSDMIGPHRDQQPLSELLAEALPGRTEHSHDQSCAQGVDKEVIVGSLPDSGPTCIVTVVHMFMMSLTRRPR